MIRKSKYILTCTIIFWCSGGVFAAQCNDLLVLMQLEDQNTKIVTREVSLTLAAAEVGGCQALADLLQKESSQMMEDREIASDAKRILYRYYQGNIANATCCTGNP